MNRATFGAFVAGAALAPRLAAAQGAATTIKLGTAPVESYALAYYALDQGFFKKAGLDVQIEPFAGGGAVMTAAAGSAIDVGCANVGAQANAHIHGLTFQMMCPGGLYSAKAPTTVLAVGKNSPIRTAKDLNGKTVGLSTLKDLQQASVMKWVDQNGGDSSTLKFLEIPTPDMSPAMNAGRIDASTMLEPALTASKSEIRILGDCYNAIARTLLITAHFASADWLAKNTATAKAFIGAMGQAAIWANKNPQASGVILAKYSKIAPETISQMNRTVFADKLDPATIQPVIDASAEYKFLPQTFPVSQMFWPQAPVV
jgi:NitT/TauT family transport system substrate-binding protein